MFCPHCGEENADNAQYCRRCGERLPDAVPGPGPAMPDRYVGEPSTALAVTALVLSCVGFVSCGVTAAVGLVLGIVALSKAKREPLRFGGEGLSIAAIAVGAVAVVGMALYLVVWIGIMGGVMRGMARSGGFPPAPVRPPAQVRPRPSFAPPQGPLEAAHMEALKSADAANLHLIGLAVAMSRKDSGGQYPESLDVLVERGYIDPDDLSISMEEAPAEETGIARYVLMGGLPAETPDRTIIAYTRKGVFDEGRNVLRTDMVVDWHTEGELAGPGGLLAESYSRLAEALGVDVTPERDAELRAFYEVEGN